MYFLRFKWSLIGDCVDENHLVEDHLVTVKTDGSIELHSIFKTSEDCTSSCDAVVGKEQLKGLLYDRGKGTKEKLVHNIFKQVYVFVHGTHHTHLLIGY